MHTDKSSGATQWRDVTTATTMGTATQKAGFGRPLASEFAQVGPFVDCCGLIWQICCRDGFRSDGFGRQGRQGFSQEDVTSKTGIGRFDLLKEMEIAALNALADRHYFVLF